MDKKIKKFDNEIKIIKESKALLKVLYWFFSYPTEPLSLSDLAKNVNISKTTANKAVTYLMQDGFLNIETLGKIWRISCNINHQYNKTYKIPFNLQQIYTSGILDAIKKETPQAQSIILFGSYMKGDDDKNSDIDIAVEVVDNKNPETITLGTTDMGYRKNVKVNLFIFSRNKVDLNVFSNIANGIVLDGFLEVRP